MKRTKPVLLGLCPIGKFVFSHEDAIRLKRQIMERFDAWGVRYVHLDAVLPDGLIRDQSHVAPAVRYFQDQRIDALFIPHCNFGTEGAAGMIAKECHVPTLLWGPRDEAPLPDGTRLRDSLCGTLATSGVLYKLRVPFSYIVNCRVDDAEFRQGLDRFLRAARVAKSLRTMRIAHLGQRIDFFWTTIISEVELLQRFGVQILPVDLVEVIDSLRKRVEKNGAAYRKELADYRRWVAFNHFRSEEDILYNFALRDEMLDLAARHELDAFAFQSFNSIPNQVGAFLQFGCSLVADAGYPVGPESDVHAAVGAVMLEAASAGNDPGFIPDITIRHPDNDNAVLLWHADAPLSLRHPESSVRVDLPWILKGLPTGLVHFRLKDGPITLCRFEGDGGGYRLGCGQGHTVPGPYTQEFYTWMEVDHWPTWERQLACGPYIHHCCCVYDHCVDVLTEAARYIPGLEIEHFGMPASAT
jgi:L-fucose isomerase-like protein